MRSSSPGFAVVADAEGVGDRRQQQTLLEHSLQEHEVRAVGEEVLGGMGDLDREAALADAARSDQAHDAVLAPLEQVADLGEVVLAADRGRVRGRHARNEGCRCLRPVPRSVIAAGLVEALGEQGGEVVRDALLEVRGRFEREVGGGVVALGCGRSAGLRRSSRWSLFLM